MNPRNLEIWAPFARNVSAFVNGEDVEMEPDVRKEGWWRTKEAYPPGTRYAFSLNGGPPLPDPRSNHQPDGPDGFSCLVDHGDFIWTDSGWSAPPLERAVIYELHVGTFSEEGTFEGVIQHLDHLVRLGVTHIELLPVGGFPGTRNWGYDCVSIHAPNQNYGGPDGLKRLVDACHAKGLGVMIDVIYNHMGAEGNHACKFGPYFTDKYQTPWGQGPDLDGGLSEEVRSFFIDNALLWLRDYHADGLRLDAIDKVTDKSPVHFLVELRLAVDRLGYAISRPLILIAESASNDPIFVTPVAEGGYGMNAQWADDVHHAFHAFLSGETENYYEDFGDLAHVEKALRQGFVYDGCYSPYRGKAHGKSPRGLPMESFVVCLQNHDQIGNRPRGERIHQLEQVGLLGQQIAAAFILLSPYTPLIFMGEEWAASTPFEFFSDHQDPEMAAAVGKGRKEEFRGGLWDQEDIPDPQDEACFTRSKLNWAERLEEGHRSMLGWYSQLLNLRAENPRPAEPAGVEADEDGAWLRMDAGNFVVIANLRDSPLTLPFPASGNFSMQLSAGAVRVIETQQLQFEGRGVAIVRKCDE